jgi:hypothetical protein
VENRLLGHTSVVVKDAASRGASEGVEKAKAVAQHTYDRAAEAAREEAGAQGFIDRPESQNDERRSGNGPFPPH